MFSLNTHHAFLNTYVVITSFSEKRIEVKDEQTGKFYTIEPNNSISERFSAGKHTLSCKGFYEELIVEDAIKFGGGKIKKAFSFDNNPWVFITTGDRLYASNIETGEEKIEYDLSPESISSLKKYYGKPSEHFLFQTGDDYSIYNLRTGKIVLSFTDYIYSNGHLVIYKLQENVIVYDFLKQEEIVKFNGQYSFGIKFYFVKDNKLHGLNLQSSYINTINDVGPIYDNCTLSGNSLLRLTKDYIFQKKYQYFFLGNGERGLEEVMIETPCYIESINGVKTSDFEKLSVYFKSYTSKVNDLFRENDYEEYNSNLKYFEHIIPTFKGLKINDISYEREEKVLYWTLSGEIVTYPNEKYLTKFIKQGEGYPIIIKRQKSCIYLSNAERREFEPLVQELEGNTKISIKVPEGESLLCSSPSGENYVTKKNGCIIFHNVSTKTKTNILINLFDETRYKNSFFSSDGKGVVFVDNDNIATIMGFEDFNTTKFDIEGSTVYKTIGVNGYKPEFQRITDNREIVWRDPITLKRVKSEEMSNHIFMSSDHKYCANINMIEEYWDRLHNTSISKTNYNSFCQRYDWTNSTTEKEKEKIKKDRRSLVDRYGEKHFIIRDYACKDTDITIPNNNKEVKAANDINNYINNMQEFSKLFIDQLYYVIYSENESETKNKILIGRDAWFLNYVSFSYDSRYLAFGAKMKKDNIWRFSEEGVFELYDLVNKKIIVRKDNDINLNAVWMTMFSKKGDVAYYDSHANAYIAKRNTNYTKIEEIPGKSLLCFSPSGKYVALSDQKYIDFSHHPNLVWGHQPSGNIFIHSTTNTGFCFESHNDFSEGIVGASPRSRNRCSVASAAFSFDDKRLLAVGDDGVVVIRNLHLPKQTEAPLLNVNTYQKKEDFEDYGSHYGEFSGSYAQDVMGFDDDTINDAFEGDPDAYWNID